MGFVSQIDVMYPSFIRAMDITLKIKLLKEISEKVVIRKLRNNKRDASGSGSVVLHCIVDIRAWNRRDSIEPRFYIR